MTDSIGREANPERQITIQKLVLFERKFGKHYRLLAYHAALPLVLTPELVHYLRTEFLGNQVPWEAEADLLLSDLCSQVGYELYAMDTDMRAYLLEQMQQDEQIPSDRQQRVAQLLISYVNYLSEINPGQRERELQAQRWAAMAYLGEEQCRQLVEEITAQFELSGGQGNRDAIKAEFARLARITQELALPLQQYPQLLEFAQQVNRAICTPNLMAPADLQRVFRIGDHTLRLPGSEFISGFPLLEWLTFTDAELVERNDSAESEQNWLLKPFSFKVGYLVNLGSGWVVQNSDGQAQRYLEQLNASTRLEMVAIPGGTFVMGSPKDERENYDDEQPQHPVTVPDFYLGRYPITQAQWRVVTALPQVKIALNPDPSRFKGDTRPVERVSWEEAIEFCARLSELTKREYRLPTEAEWEYACRTGTTTPFHFGETIPSELANYNARYAYGDGVTGEYRQETTPVDHFGVANAWGLCDMHGNVREWCQDHWHDNYKRAPKDGSVWLSRKPDAARVWRGGSWFADPRYCRSAYRFYSYPGARDDGLGFRVACSTPGNTHTFK